jgi:hypothetical protein
MRAMESDMQGQDKKDKSVLDDKQKFEHGGADEKIAHMGDKPAQPQQQQPAKEQQK